MKSALILIFSIALILAAIPAGSLAHQPLLQPDDANVSSDQTIIEDERGIVALDQSLREITNPFTVLCVAARPGDEDDGTLAYVRKKLGARAVILFATRGEGEDSRTRPELDAELGVVHTAEAIEAARILGADLFFLNLRDIGYSKSADEALSIWGHDDALRRMVRAIRALRPDVIITSHNQKTGEGVERAVARLAVEGFKAAASTEIASEAGTEVWKTRRFFQRSVEPTRVKVDLNEYDRVRGATYARIGLTAHQRFLSRGAGFDRPTPDRDASYYSLVASSSEDEIRPAAAWGTGLLDGLTISENVSRSIAQPRVGGLGVVDAIATGERLVDALIERLIEKRAEGTADALRERYGAEFVKVFRYTAALERAIAIALGLSLDVTTSDHVAVPGQIFSARVVLRNGGVRAFPVVFSTPELLAVPGKDAVYKDSEVIGVGPGGVGSKEAEYSVAKDAALTLPHSQNLYNEDYYPVGSALPGAQPAQPFGNRLIVFADVGLGQVNIRIAALARYDIASPVEIATIPFALVRDWSKEREISFPVRVRNRTPGRLAGALWIVPLALADDEYDPVHIAFSREDEEVIIRLKLRLPILKPPLAPDVLLEFRREKPAAPNPLGSAKIAVKAGDFETIDNVKVGYVRGLTDWVPFALNELGVKHSELVIDDISITEHGNANKSAQSRIGCADLAGFDTIIIDGSAYFGHPELIRHNRCLLRYVRQGGNLLVLEQIPDDWNLVLANTQFAPYAIKLSRDRIVYENSAVRILDQDHPLLTKPNKISPKDFEGWLVERALNIPRVWSNEYTPLLETSDPGEEPSRGGLLVARYGEGTYVFTSYQWQRQLRAGNTGAYRVFANLITFPKVVRPPVKPQ